MVLVETNSSPHDPHAREKSADPPTPARIETPRGLLAPLSGVLTAQFGAMP